MCKIKTRIRKSLDELHARSIVQLPQSSHLQERVGTEKDGAGVLPFVFNLIAALCLFWEDS